MASVTQQELAAAQSLIQDHLYQERSRSAGDIEVSAGELSRRLGLQRETVAEVMATFANAPQAPVTAAGRDRWQVTDA